MKRNGFIIEPERLMDVVRMADGRLTSLDTTRVLAAERAGINVYARVFEHTDLLPNDLQYVSRFLAPNNAVPTTFGEAVANRIGSQNSAQYRGLYPLGSPYVGTRY
jgi:hypothetical protein